ncbi:serine/threonine-protein kinase [Kibdelosporangium aridum]|uniref:serine/threonine-protein kinase n=1 Tax=Kibdelosporangium aridum TaxID=2030 RepID=UPI0035E9D6E8
MAKCQRPGCGGETAFGKCTQCGAPDQQAWTPPQQPPKREDEAGTGWFRHPDVLSGSQPSPPKPSAPNATSGAQPPHRPSTQPPQQPRPVTQSQQVPQPKAKPDPETLTIRPVTPPHGQPAPAPGQWAQGVQVPAVQPQEMYSPLADVPQPTSVLATAEPTQSIVPPKPVVEEAPPSQDSQPRSDSVPFPGPGHGTGSRRTSSRVARGRGLGAGLVDVPPVPYRDPTSAVMTDPVVAENKRFCGNCGAAVGRGADGEPGAAEGECPNCGARFSFKPRLRRGDILGGQYEVLGCLAYGGLGWIYLAKDHNVSDRWVVLKGLIDTGDPTALAAAVAEQRFLAQVEHANILKIYNFVQAPDPTTGTSVGYIVMEYVGGQSLRQIALEHHRTLGRAEPLPIGQVIAYGLEILPAMGYLHSIGLLYCDLKPDNVIQTNETLKLIDLGAVRREDDYESPLFFTLGYSAPELSERGASVASDIYTVGRTLAVLSIEFTGYTGKYRHTLPGPDEMPLFKLFDSYYRVLKRATHPDPDRRFPTAEDMAEQLTGVLREVMALGTNRPRPGVSTVFGPEPRTFGATVQTDERGVSLTVPDPSEVIGALPVPQVDTDDPAAGVLAATVASDLNDLVEALTHAPQNSVEVRLRMMRARTELGDIARASGELELARRMASDPHDWRLQWHRGLLELAMRRPNEARAAFDAVYDALPGEAAPKLALGISLEYLRDYFGAARFYEQVWRTDRSYVSAAFGLVRVYLAQGARAGAIEVLESVPDSSSHYVAAQVAAIKIKARAHEVAKLAEPDLYDAARRLERLALDAERRTQLSVEVLEAAYGWVKAGRPGGGHATGTVLGCNLSERELRFGLERCYRALARLASTPEQRHELVDRANAIRPRTLT